MIDTTEEILPEVTKRNYEDDSDVNADECYYVEKESRTIYAVRFFDEYAVVRLASPDPGNNVFRISLITLAEDFDEYAGDPKSIRDYLWGEHEEMLVKKKD